MELEELYNELETILPGLEDEETLNLLAVFYPHIELRTAFVQPEDGPILTEYVMSIARGDKIQYSDPIELIWPLIPFQMRDEDGEEVPIPEQMVN